MRSFLLLALLLCNSAHAYMPPAFFLYEKLAEVRNSPVQAAAFQLSIYRMRAGGTEEPLGEITQNLGASNDNEWPSLTLLISNDQAELVAAVQKFGLKVLDEQDLLITTKEKLEAMKQPPRRFYRKDPNVYLRRLSQVIAWVHASTTPNNSASKSFWMEKENFLPLKVEAPCPELLQDYDPVLGGFVADLSKLPVDTTAGKKDALNPTLRVSKTPRCELEYRNVYGVRRMEFQAARLYIKRDGIALFQIRLEKILSTKNPENSANENTGKLDAKTRDLVSLFLH